MAIKLKDNDNGEKNLSKNGNDMSKEGEDSKFHANLIGGTDDIEKVRDLPTYDAPVLVDQLKVGVNSNSSKARSIITKLIGLLFLIAVIYISYRVTSSLLGSNGEDITDKLTHTEEQLAKELDLEFKENNGFVKSVPQYSAGTVTVNTGGTLNVIYINGKQVGLNTTGHDYKFFNMGINEPEYSAVKEMSYQYDGCFVMMDDLLVGNSKAYYYYNKANNDCLVVIVNEKSNRIVSLTYYTDYKKITEKIEVDDD